MAMAVVVVYYFTIIKGLRWLARTLPDSRVKEFLFRERGSCPPQYGATRPGQVLLDQDAIRSRKP